MKVGIVTQPLEMNYGGILQNWALQQALKRLGHDPITIDAYQRFTLPHYLFSLVRTFIKRLQHKPGWDYAHRYHGSLRRKETGRFVEQHIAKTKVLWEYDRKVVNRYGLEGIIVGSDQVWRIHYNKSHIEDMFLKFAQGLPLRRIAYAASFGVDNWMYTPEQTAACAALAQEFDAISVREASAVEHCRKNFGVEAIRVLDPTLLLNAQDYQSIIDSNWNPGEPYLAVYCLDHTRVKSAFFNRIAEERGLPVRYFTAGLDAKLTIEQWLAMFYHATMMVTDSFHGTVFSILFGKEFYTLGNPRRGNARIQGLLGLVGLNDRLLSEKEPDESQTKEIDWQSVYSLLDEERNRSMEFLSSSLAPAEKE